MRNLRNDIEKGFTLIEMMLVAAIISGFIFMGIGYTQQRTRALMMDRTSAQMQQILNSGLSYYVNNGTWPTNIAALQADSYLPATVTSPFGTTYSVSSTASIFTVSVSLPAGYANSSAIAQMIAGKLPFGVSTSVTPAPSPSDPSPVSTSTISASVNIPAQNLNNVGNVSYTGVYHSGACVPVPACPTINANGASLTPVIEVVPVSFSGMYDPGSDTTVYPLTSITAMTSDKTYADLSTGVGPAACGNDTSLTSTSCYSDSTLETPLTADGSGRTRTPITTGKYWRVCLYVNTQAGEVTWDALTGSYAQVLVLTRCKVSTESAGSTMNVWGY